MSRKGHSKYHKRSKMKSCENYSAEEIMHWYNKLVEDHNKLMEMLRDKNIRQAKAVENLKEKFKEKVKQNQKGARKLQIPYNMTLIYAFLEKEREKLGFSRKYLRLMILLYQYDEIKMDDFARLHPDMMKYGWTLFENIRLLSKDKFVIRHRHGKESTTLCLSMLGRRVIDNLNKKAKEFHRNEAKKEISDLWD